MENQDKDLRLKYEEAIGKIMVLKDKIRELEESNARLYEQLDICKAIKEAGE